MRLNKSSLTSKLIIAIGLIMVLGFIASIMINPDTRWLQWHLSRLGETDQVSAPIFNTSLIVSGLLMISFAWLIRRNLLADKFRQKETMPVFGGLVYIGLAMIGLALAPFNTHPDLHKFFSYSAFLIFLVLTFYVPIKLKIFANNHLMIILAAVLAAISVVWLGLVGPSDLVLLPEFFDCGYMLAWMGFFSYSLNRFSDVKK
jgi:hypothetical membrane protein